MKTAGDAQGAIDPAPDPIDVESEIERLHARSYGWALSCCDWDKEEASDVLQLAYLKLLDGRAKFAGRSLFSTFLFGVIRRTASERRRRRFTRKVLLLRHATETRALEPEVEQPIAIPVARLREALRDLPLRQREVIHLVFYDECSVREASEIMGIGLGSARVHYDRAKKRLREWLRDEYEREMNR